MPEQGEANLAIEGVVHDLNNVLQTILESADLLATDPNWSRLAAALRRSVQRGQCILGGLCEDTTATVDLGEIVEGAMQFAGDVLRALHISGIEFQCQLEPGIRLKGNPTAWERALFNLLVNAAQAMRQGGIIEIHGRQSGSQIEITVADTGTGIPSEILPHIFSPHFSTKPSSSGLGLNIVQSIVRQNGGSVCARNRSGSQGAVFCITVPA